jgi:hypothetical protein
MKTIYIAGPMGENPAEQFPAFDEAAERFRAAGFAVISPADIARDAGYPENHGETTYEQFLAADIHEMVAQECEAIALLPCWWDSRGARLEVAIAMSLGFSFYDATTLQLLPRPEHIVIKAPAE